MATVREWYGTGVPDPTTISTSTAGTGDDTFDVVSGTATWVAGWITVGTSAGATSLRWNSLGLSACGTRFYFKSGPTLATVPIAQAFNSGGTLLWYLSQSSSAQIQLRTQSGTAASNFSSTQGLIYRIEATTNGTADQIRFRVYDASETNVHDATQDIGTQSNYDAISFGRNSSTSAGPLYFKNIKVVDTATLVGADNIPPELTLSANQNVAAGATVTVTASATDFDGTIASYAWSVVSASSTSTPTLTGASTATVTFTAPAAGNLVTLQCVVTDDAGATVTVATEVRVPVAGGTTAVPLALAAISTSGIWTRAGAASTDGAALADASDTTYMESPTLTGTQAWSEYRLQPSSPRSAAAFVLRLGNDSGSSNVTVTAREGGIVLQTWTQAVNASATDYTFTWDATALSTINDHGNVRVRIGATT